MQPSWKYGHRFNKPDLQRNALFAEMEYLHGARYKPPVRGAINDKAMKGKQMATYFPKIKTGLQDCYFDHEFARIFIGEALAKPKRKRKKEDKEGKKKEKPPFRPPPTPKWHSTPGDIYGTFTTEMEAFSPRTRPPPRRKIPPRKNIVTKPGKKGGTGYANICLSPYPAHLPDPYDAGPKRYRKNYKAHMKKVRGPMIPPHPTKYFDPNPYRLYPGQQIRRIRPKKPPKIRFTFYPPALPKDIGGCKAGCFDKYPSHSADKYLSPAQIAKFIPRSQRKKQKKVKEGENIFYPPICNITTPSFSVVNYNADLRTNGRNWETAKTFTFPLIELGSK